MIADRRPDVVFNCAAYNAVDRAETDALTAFDVNGKGPGNLAAACRRRGASLVHFSTNFVFDGVGAEPYVESDEPSPVSVYGRSKLAGEQAVLLEGTHVLVIRTAGVFGTTTGRSFPERIVERARAGDKIRVVSDQAINPTYAKDLAVASVDLAEKGFAGIVHAVADGCCGWDELARVVLADSGIKVHVESVATGEIAAAARRPANGCLATIRYHALRSWREAVGDWARARQTP